MIRFRKDLGGGAIAATLQHFQLDMIAGEDGTAQRDQVPKMCCFLPGCVLKKP